MKIILAKSAGYCFGVRDAVNAAYDASKEHGAVSYTHLTLPTKA